MDLGARIRNLREAKDMPLGELAEAVNISKSMLCQLERGTKILTVPMLRALAAALDCKLSDILGE